MRTEEGGRFVLVLFKNVFWQMRGFEYFLIYISWSNTFSHIAIQIFLVKSMRMQCSQPRNDPTNKNTSSRMKIAFGNKNGLQNDAPIKKLMEMLLAEWHWKKVEFFQETFFLHFRNHLLTTVHISHQNRQPPPVSSSVVSLFNGILTPPTLFHLQ